MSIAGELNILATTKAVQRRHLERLYPYLDWSKMPFSSYIDFFALKNIMDDCGAIWTNAYRKSNDEDAETRKYLTDYSGNGRDIELFNFAFAGMSGYGGYGSTSWNAYGDKAEQTSGNVVNISLESSDDSEGVLPLILYKGESVKIRYKITGYQEGCLLRAYTNTRNAEGAVVPTIIRTITADGIYEDTFEWDSENAATDSTGSQVFIICSYSKATSAINMTIEQLPLYPGALVSDGIDDYGQCIKGFALPDDYTVVAIRKPIKINSAALITKGANFGAFIFESVSNYSYGTATTATNKPPLFSYLTKNSYNGTPIASGTAVDNLEDNCLIFSHNKTNYQQAALYALGIFTRTLTVEELRIVKNCMMAEWAAMTGELDGITYVADWDAKGRSNDEEEPMRSKWIDKVNGRVINLSNYSFSEMSGWGGYAYDFLNFRGNYSYSEHTPTKIQVQSRNEGSSAKTIAEQYLKNDDTIGLFTFPGLYVRISNPNDIPLVLDYYPISGTTINLHEGINYIPEKTIEITDEMAIKKSAIRFLIGSSYVGDFQNLGCTLELLPLYPGALVSDGVDDYGVSAEVIDEPIGSVIMHAESLSENFGKYLYGMSGNINNRIYCWIDSSGHVAAGAPSSVVELPFLKYTREPVAPNLQLWVSSVNNNSHCKSAIFRLILIQEQLDAAQLEFLQWKVEKEYRDSLIRNGWEGIETPEEEWYGIEWDVTDPSPDVKRIGNMEMHKTLPVHSQITGVLLDDTGAELKVLGDDWTAETRDGSAGQVMVKMLVDSYWKFESDGNKRRVKLSDKELSGFTRTPLGYVSAYEASLDRYNYKLASVVDTSGRYRGGNNQDSWDNSYNTQIGRPATNISRTYFRTYARSRQSGSNKWNIMTYDFQKLIYWLFAVEYATLDTQKTFNAEKSTEGYAQGGLGDGVTLLKGTTWNTFSAYYPFIPCGYSDSFGNSTGQSAYTMPFEYDVMYHGGAAVSYIGEYDPETAYTSGQFVSQDEELYECIADAAAGTALTDTTHFSKVTRTVVYVPRYRGIENPFGHIWQWTDGINVRINPNYDDGTNGLSEVFVCSDPSKFSDNGYVGYRHVSNGARDQYFVSEILFGDGGEIMPKTCEGSSDTYFCDNHYMTIPVAVTLRAVMFGGSANNGANAGLICSDSTFLPSFTDARFGTRLCFIPEEENTNS